MTGGMHSAALRSFNVLLQALFFLRTRSQPADPGGTFGTPLKVTNWAPKPWKTFNNEVGRSMAQTISSRPSERRAQQAAAVVKDIENIYDDVLRKHFRNLGYGFTAIAWSGLLADIPEAFKPIFIEGGTIPNFGKIDPRRTLVDGALLSRRCDSERKEERVIGRFGVPCQNGCSVYKEVVTGQDVAIRCVVFYFPLQSKLKRTLYMKQRFDAYYQKATSIEAEPRLHVVDSSKTINLTNMAFNFFKAAGPLRGDGGSSRQQFLFKVVLCLPVASPVEKEIDHDHLFDAPNIGISSEVGYTIVDSHAVPVPLDLNLPAEDYELRLAFLATAPVP